MAEHTPGPWAVDPRRFCIENCAHQQDTFSVLPAAHIGRYRGWAADDDMMLTQYADLIADVHTERRFGGTERAQANARLIAAAPDLLAACEGLLALAELNGHLGEKRGEWQASGMVLIHPDQKRDCGAAVLAARDAIAQATGGQP